MIGTPNRLVKLRF